MKGLICFELERACFPVTACWPAENSIYFLTRLFLVSFCLSAIAIDCPSFDVKSGRVVLFKARVAIMCILVLGFLFPEVLPLRGSSFLSSLVPFKHRHIACHFMRKNLFVFHGHGR